MNVSRNNNNNNNNVNTNNNNTHLVCGDATNMLELLEFDSNSNTNVIDFYYYPVILNGIEFGIKFS